MNPRTIHVELPAGWRELTGDGPGRAYSPEGVGRGILRVSLQPPHEEELPDEEAVARAFESLAADAGIEVGQVIHERPIAAPLGPGLLRIGKHSRYGIVAVGMVFGEVTVLAMYEMGNPKLAAEELKQVAGILGALRAE
jgi:hypothetical protein